MMTNYLKESNVVLVYQEIYIDVNVTTYTAIYS